jgi:acetyl esterase/lipase
MTEIPTEDITYRTIGGEPLLGRLYRPQGSARAPLLVDAHGGAWVQGDRLNNATMHRALAASGIAVFAIDFRLAPAHRFPAAVQDINFAVRWIKANAGRLGLQPTLFGGLGTSSGGHLITLCAVRPHDALYAPADPSLAENDASMDLVVACCRFSTRYRVITWPNRRGSRALSRRIMRSGPTKARWSSAIRIGL